MPWRTCRKQYWCWSSLIVQVWMDTIGTGWDDFCLPEAILVFIIIIVQLWVDNKQRGQTMPWKTETFWSRSICSKFWGFALPRFLVPLCTALLYSFTPPCRSTVQYLYSELELLDSSAFVPNFGVLNCLRLAVQYCRWIWCRALGFQCICSKFWSFALI